MKNQDIRELCQYWGIEWEELAASLRMPMKDLVRRMNDRTVSREFRRHLLRAIQTVRSRPEDFYHENY